MNSETNCPQCGNGAGIYVERWNEYNESICRCHLCGFERTSELVNNYYVDSETKEVADKQGYGVMCMIYDESLGFGYGVSRRLIRDSDVESLLVLFDRLTSMGFAISEKSYFTKADGNDVQFIRGDLSKFYASYDDSKCYCSYSLSDNKGNCPCKQCSL